ncbi:MAG: uL30 family ribosomal protein [Candidatus Pacearchaeota archaeon]|jgi:large subunit ribosomal protein L30
MICIIRISGDVKLDHGVRETLNRLRLGRKYACVVINPKKEEIGMINKVRNFIAFGTIENNIFEKLIEKRGKRIDKKKMVDAKKVIEGLDKGKKYEELNLKPFFRLHPPRGGIDSKIHFPKGVLGDNGEKINDLLVRML